MAHTTGTAADHEELLSKLKDWMTGTVAWTELKWTPTTHRKELWLQGTGAGAGQPVIVGFLSGVNAGGDAGLEIRCSLDYDAALSFTNQASGGPNVWFNISSSTMTYWFYANTRRIIIVVKCATSYISAYLGFFLPFALPTEYPFPLYIAGNARFLTSYTWDNSANRMIADPGTATAYYHRREASAWRRMSNHTEEDGENWAGKFNNTITAFLWPARNLPSHYSNSDKPAFGTQMFENMRPVPGGARPIFQCHIVDPASEAFVGALDGVFYLPGHGLTTEQEITSSGRTFRVFQNIGRSTPRDFFCVEEV